MINPNTEYTDQTFRNLNYSHTQLRSNTFQDCVFEHCNFSEAVFLNCRFINCVVKNCDLSLAQIPGCVFQETKFESSKLVGINWSQAHWPEKKLWHPVDFKKCVLGHSTFLAVDLSESRIKRCEAINVDFREANLTKVDFAFTDLKESLFQKTKLSKADLRYARNYQIDPSQNEITGAKFSLPEALSLLYSMDIELIDEDY
jgi:fluoroquinolone resistance protein